MKRLPESEPQTAPLAAVLDPIQPKKESKIMMYFLILVLGISLVALGYSVKGVLFPGFTGAATSVPPSLTPLKSMSTMSLTSYDKGLARKMMDKDNDGKCDACGMPVEMCMDSGELQCTMGSTSGIGKLGSQHIHADWKVYLNGKALDFGGKDHMSAMRTGVSASSFIHVDSGAPTPEKTGDILHMHATGVPLWIFFEGIDLKLPEGMKMYVNGKQISDYKNYVFKDLDTILVTDGKGDLNQQLNSITDFAPVHSPKVMKATSALPSQVQLPENLQSSAPMHFASVEEEIEYMKKNAANPQNINIEKAVRGMDKNLDGVCDTCGMAILHCIEGGMEEM